MFVGGTVDFHRGEYAQHQHRQVVLLRTVVGRDMQSQRRCGAGTPEAEAAWRLRKS